MKKLKIVYCMGSGRSGSTLLGIILGNHKNILNTGEINSFYRLTDKNLDCSCQEKIINCEFWIKVFDTWRKKSSEEAIERTFTKSKRIENFKSPIAWLKAFMGYPFQANYYNDYLEHLHNFFLSLSEVSGKAIIMDISKNPLRAFILMQHPQIDLRLIHLVRDGRGVAWSLNKRVSSTVKQRPIWRTSLFWSIVNRQSNLVRKKHVRSTLIRYEDFVSSPGKILEEIGKVADIDLNGIAQSLKDGMIPNVSHIMAGNKLRRQKEINLKLDNEWKTKLSNNQKKTFLLYSKKLLRSYGYP